MAVLKPIKAKLPLICKSKSFDISNMTYLKLLMSFCLIGQCLGNAYAQTLSPPFMYYDRYQEGDSPEKLPHLVFNYFIGNYRASINGYLNIPEQDRQPYMLYNLSISYALNGNIDSAFFYLEELNKKGFNNLLYLEYSPDLKKLKSDPRWLNIVAECKKNLELYNQSITFPDIRIQLLRMVEFDQFTDFIFFIKSSTNAYSEITEEMRLKEKKRIYTSNFDTLKSLVREYGILGKSKVGEDGAQAVWLIAQHANHDVLGQEFILNQMKRTQKGEFTNNNIAYLTDRVLKGKQKKQLYGTQSWENPKTKEWEIYPTRRPKKVNERRSLMGLPPLL